MNKTKPLVNELPSIFADRMGLFYTEQTTTGYKKNKGQFFTPIPIARFMASFCNSKSSHLKILDPGCGTAILSCALLENILNTKSDLSRIELVVYETDLDIIFYTRKVLNYLKKWLRIRGIDFTYTLYKRDFILDNFSKLNTGKAKKFDVIISNPPYFKLSKDDNRIGLVKDLLGKQTNIYSIFIGMASNLLTKEGELIFITPRSFASGNYFKAFREKFFSKVQLDSIHLFNSRKETFDRDNVLQEIVIIKAKNKKRNNEVLISSSLGVKDINNSNKIRLNFADLIDMNSVEKILHLPINDKEKSLLKLVSLWENKLIDYGIRISTGRVVSFRALKYIQSNYENGTVFLAPLIWIHNIQKMSLEWPKLNKDKGQYIRIEENSIPVLIPNKNYIFLRRFSTKEDKSRLIAAPYFCNYQKSDFIGVENKVNYIYHKDGSMDKVDVAGLCALINSDFFDSYFKIFNGNVNVSATELREMKLPEKAIIVGIGQRIIDTNDYSLENVNRIVNEQFEINLLVK